MHFTEVLLLATSPMIQRFHLNFNNIPAGSTCRAAQKHQKRPSTRVKNLFSFAISAHRSRFPPFRKSVFSGSTHHPGPAGIAKNRNRRIRLRISRKSVRGIAISAI